MEIDSSGNAHITGNYFVIEYFADGCIAWVEQLDWFPTDLALYQSGVFYATGMFMDYTTAKFVPSTWTILIYMDGDNDLSSCAFEDINEMELGTDSLSNVTCIVLYDSTMEGGGDSRILKVGQDAHTLTINSEIIDDGGVVIPPSHEVNMGDPNTLKAFATWAIEQYPADHYVLIMWDHGSGWQKRGEDDVLRGYGLCIDSTNNDDRLYVDEIKDALASITQETGVIFDVIGFDACLMGMLENAYQIRDYGKVMVASEELIPGDGWCYDSILLALSHSACWNAESLGVCIVKDYIRSYTDGLGNPNDRHDVTLSAIDLSGIENLAMSVSDLGEALDAEWSTIESQRDLVEYYSVPENVDLLHLASLIGSSATDPDIVTSAQNVLNAVDLAVIFDSSGSLHPNSNGLSIYFPDQISKYNSIYENKPDLSLYTFWDEFLRRYNTYSAGEGPFAPVIEVPFYAPVGEPFEVSWTASFDADEVQSYKLLELEHINTLFFDDAESGEGDWLLDGFSITTTLSGSPTHSFYSNPPNEYNDNVTHTMTSKDPIIVPEDSTLLSLWCKWEIETNYDFLFLEVATNVVGPWAKLDSLTGVQGSRVYLSYDLTAFSDSSIYIRFRYITDYAGAKEGAYVDDIKVESIGSTTVLSEDVSSLTYSVSGREEGRYYYQVMAKDQLHNWGHWSNREYVTAGSYMPGDANGDGIVNVGDIVYMVNYLYKGGDPPAPVEAGDANCDGVVNVGDVVYLVNYLFRQGPPPCR